MTYVGIEINLFNTLTKYGGAPLCSSAPAEKTGVDPALMSMILFQLPRLPNN